MNINMAMTARIITGTKVIGDKTVYTFTPGSKDRKDYSQMFTALTPGGEKITITRDYIMQEIELYATPFGYSHFYNDRHDQDITHIHKNNNSDAFSWAGRRFPKDVNGDPLPYEFEMLTQKDNMYHEKWYNPATNTIVHGIPESGEEYVYVTRGDAGLGRAYHNLSDACLIEFHNWMATYVFGVIDSFKTLELQAEVANDYLLDINWCMCPHCGKITRLPEIRLENVTCPVCDGVIAECNCDGRIDPGAIHSTGTSTNQYEDEIDTAESDDEEDGAVAHSENMYKAIFWYSK